MMISNFEDSFQEIGKAALTIAGTLAGKLLLYAEVEDGVVSADLIYETDQGNARFRFAPDSLKEFIYSFWERWSQEQGNREWRVLCYEIKDGRFNVEFTYPDQIQPDEELSDRRPRAIRKVFGEMIVDYSKP